MKPVFVSRLTPLRNSEEDLLNLVRHRAARATTNQLSVNFANRRHFGCRSGEEGFTGREQIIKIKGPRTSHYSSAVFCSDSPERLFRVVVERMIFACEPVASRGRADVQGHRIFERFGRVLNSRRDVEHLIRRERHIAAW
ncbi:MAG: hypothetical protein QOC96_1724 [Acidobacteriota bacterium]|nr:hypothetical protein [Acidobacteriota bacterium]